MSQTGPTEKYNNFTFSLTTPDLFVRVAPGYSFTLLLKYSYFCFIWSLDTDECWFGESLESKSIDTECNIQHTLILYKATWCSIAASSTSNMPGLLPAPELKLSSQEKNFTTIMKVLSQDIKFIWTSFENGLPSARVIIQLRKFIFCNCVADFRISDQCPRVQQVLFQ